MALSTLDQTTYKWDLTHQTLDRLGRGDVGIPGWERFRDVKPIKRIPHKVEEIILDLVFKGTKKPITALKAELAVQEIVYDPVYGDYIKAALKARIQAIKDDEDEMLIMIGFL